jgi:hypothetical protein
MRANVLGRWMPVAAMIGSTWALAGCVESLSSAARQQASGFFGCDAGDLTVVKDDDIPQEANTKYFKVTGCRQSAVYQCSSLPRTGHYVPNAAGNTYVTDSDARVSCTRVGSGEVDRQPQ